jgi:endonuclease YncB( thermonuclease family)
MGCAMRLFHLALFAGFCCAAPAAAQAPPACAGPVEIATVKVTRVENNGAIVLADGRAVLLEGIRLPRGDADHASRFVADGALAALREMTVGRKPVFTAIRPKEDRYDRVRSQGFVGEAWLQLALLSEGLARVDIAPDRSECAGELYRAERAARAARKGLWDLPAYRVRGPAGMRGDAGTFQIAEGGVANVGSSDGRSFIDFTVDWRHGLAAVISPDDRKAFRDFDLEGLRGHRIRVRGMVEDMGGRQEIQLSNPAQIEILN